MKRFFSTFCILSVLLVVSTGCTAQGVVSGVNSNNSSSKALNVSGGVSSVIIEDSKVTVPDLIGSTEDVAKQILPNIGLVPKLSYQYSDTQPKGTIFKIVPEANSKISKGSSVNVYISKGPETEVPNSVNGTWYHTDPIADNLRAFEINNATINKDVLNINLSLRIDMYAQNIVFKRNGIASLNSNFASSIPINYTPESDNLLKGIPQKVDFQIPLESLNADHPNTIYLRLYTTVFGYNKNFDFSINFEWKKAETDSSSVDDGGQD